MVDHNWTAQTKTIHHDAEVKPAWDEVVSEAWDEPVYESHAICNKCGLDLTATGTDSMVHIDEVHDGAAGWHDEKVQTGTVHHEAETVHHPEKTLSPAWDEEVVTGYVCSVCGAQK